MEIVEFGVDIDNGFTMIHVNFNNMMFVLMLYNLLFNINFNFKYIGYQKISKIWNSIKIKLLKKLKLN